MLDPFNFFPLVGHQKSHASWLIFFLFTVVQAEQLSEFYEVCKSIHIGRGERFLKIEQVWLIL